MLLGLDPACRTTRRWAGPEVAPQVQAALQAALTPQVCIVPVLENDMQAPPQLFFLLAWQCRLTSEIP